MEKLDPGFYLRLDEEPTPEQFEQLKTLLGEVTLIAIRRKQPELLPFDSQEHGASLGEISKDEFIELVATYHPRSRKNPNHFHNVLARNTWNDGEERRPFIKPNKNVDLQILYSYLLTGEQSAMGGGDLFHKVMIQVVNGKIIELQTEDRK